MDFIVIFIINIILLGIIFGGLLWYYKKLKDAYDKTNELNKYVEEIFLNEQAFGEHIGRMTDLINEYGEDLNKLNKKVSLNKQIIKRIKRM